MKPSRSRFGGASVSRRDFLAMILAAAATGRVLPALARLQTSASVSWLDTVADRQAAARLGAAYLTGHADEGDPEGLAAAIVDAAGIDPKAAPMPSPAQLLGALDRAVRADYVAGRTVVVDRWLLSRTEARVYAYAARAPVDSGLE